MESCKPAEFVNGGGGSRKPGKLETWKPAFPFCELGRGGGN